MSIENTSQFDSTVSHIILVFFKSKSREETPPLAEVFEDPSGYQGSGSPAARVPSPLLLEAVPPVQPRTASPLSVPARKHKAVPARKLAPLTMPVVSTTSIGYFSKQLLAYLANTKGLKKTKND